MKAPSQADAVPPETLVPQALVPQALVPETLDRRIRTDIETKIFSGQWPPGHRIPFEHELQEHYKCSRMTVSKALSGLAATGLIERRRRAGSFVAHRNTHAAMLEIREIKAEVTARGELYDYTLVERSRHGADQVEPIRMAVAGDVLALRCLHFANWVPFAYGDRLINFATVPEAMDQDFSETPPGSWLLWHVQWTEAEHVLSAVNADMAMSRLLKIPPGTACIVVERRTWRLGEPVTFVRLTYPGTAYHPVAKFTPGKS